MRKTRVSGLDFEVDKLTNSIENQITGDSFQTQMSIVKVGDLNTVSEKMDGYLTGKRRAETRKGMSTN